VPSLTWVTLRAISRVLVSCQMLSVARAASDQGRLQDAGGQRYRDQYGDAEYKAKNSQKDRTRHGYFSYDFWTGLFNEHLCCDGIRRNYLYVRYLLRDDLPVARQSRVNAVLTAGNIGTALNILV